ncbi:MAG: polysaccharide pyruvyl transferase family protein [Microbacteriaceae bacterium]|nr:polysaccharide pyruvyl transferase family protein [Microbacteriaceae bacterium]
MPKAPEIVVCSFYTPDKYYANHAKRLKGELESLGVHAELKKVTRPAGVDWADVTRMKIGFIREIAKQFPNSKVFWVDVDCSLIDLPDFIRESSADLIGFQRSFGQPLSIGYQNRTRFWEPSFWGMGTSPQARKLIEDAYQLEQRSTIKATDDYFLEEAWRANAKNLSFQVIPSNLVIKNKASKNPHAKKPFFAFGSSGNVAEFKNKVTQHGTKKRKLRSRALTAAKQIEANLPDSLRSPLRKVADSSGATDLLTQGKPKGLDPVRTKTLNDLFQAATTGDVVLYSQKLEEFENKYLPTAGEVATLDVARTLLGYSAKESDNSIKLAWWAKPHPGNFGDWLSPLIFSHFTDAKIIYQPPTKPKGSKHLFAVGSIGRFIGSKSVVVGTGVSDQEISMSRSADYVSVRGPLTAETVKNSGGPEITAFGDPGLVISEVMPIKRGKTNGKIALVRHFTHSSIPLKLPDNIEELDVLVGSPESIKEFLTKLNKYDAVITSAMHVMIACQSYGIPCGLITFKGYEENVHGTGIKYIDYAKGAGVKVLKPKAVGNDFTAFDYQKLINDIKVSDSKKQEVIGHIKAGITKLTAR